MARLADLAVAETTLTSPQVAHLQRLVASWSLPCDLAFADLLLYVPTNASAEEFVVIGHVRPATAATFHVNDPVGTRVLRSQRPAMSRCLLDGQRLEVPIAFPPPAGAVDDTVEEGVQAPIGTRFLLADHVPVRCGDEIIAVMAREGEAGLTRTFGQLEREYRDLFGRFCQMVEDGSFPLERAEQSGEFREPRVGDGVLVLDRERRIEFASPNALSALHRLGVRSEVVGRRLDAFGLADGVVRRALETRFSTIAEVERAEVSIVVRCHPLLNGGRATGVLVLLRDVSELRSRDRLLVSKDATIREIHHRVKNNLQTIQSLLHLQQRRLDSAEAKRAVAQSARRIGSIAIVHETLSSDATDEVDFDVVARRVLRLVEEGFDSPERPLRVGITGSIGELAGQIAMPLAVALAEVVQNAVDHGEAGRNLEVDVSLLADPREVGVRIVDNGPGLPEGFSLDRDVGLGLTIVRTFIISDLGGTMTIGRAHDREPLGTVVEFRVPRRLSEATSVG